ncbi:MAG: type VI secretion system baseplate subunit TssK [Polyangiaceae bacterium]|nr:type VI secretion system baseplate subunit TssK [Polyangiaceae bacterium]
MKPHWPARFQLHAAHLEARDAYAENLAAHRLAVLQPYAYGVVNMEVDEEALGNGILRLRRFKAIFPSGLMVDVPLERNAAKLFTDMASSLPVHIGVPKLGPGSNVNPQDGLVRSVRYQTTGETIMRAHPEILFGREATERFELVSVGSLQRVGARFCFDPTVWPTLVRIRGATQMQKAFGQFLLALGQRQNELRRDLGGQPLHREAFTTIDTLEPMELTLLLGEYVPLFWQCARDNVHPRKLYELLNAFYGALRIFGAKERRPRYEHTKLGEIFPWFFRRIETLVKEAARHETTILPFVRLDQVTFDLSFRAEDLLGKRPYLVANGAPEGYLRSEVPRIVKMAGSNEIDRLKRSAVRGVRLAEEFEPPGLLAHRRDMVVYRIDVRDPFWLDIVDRRRIVLFLPGAPATLRFFLCGVKRTF